MQQGADALHGLGRLTLGLRMERAWRSARAAALAAMRFPLDLLLKVLAALLPGASRQSRVSEGGPGFGIAPQPPGNASGSRHLQHARAAAERGLGREGSEGLHERALQGWQSAVQVTLPTHRKVE